MRLDQSPSFRKVATPWHDSNLFHAIVALLMLVVFLFGNIGFRITLDNEAYWGYRWVPLLVMILSGLVLAINLTRLTFRLLRRFSEDTD